MAASTSINSKLNWNCNKTWILENQRFQKTQKSVWFFPDLTAEISSTLINFLHNLYAEIAENSHVPRLVCWILKNFFWNLCKIYLLKFLQTLEFDADISKNRIVARLEKENFILIFARLDYWNFRKLKWNLCKACLLAFHKILMEYLWGCNFRKFQKNRCKTWLFRYKRRQIEIIARLISWNIRYKRKLTENSRTTSLLIFLEI